MNQMPAEDFEDLVENVISKIYAGYKSAKIKKILAYAYGAMDNEIKDYWRKKRRNEMLFSHEDDNPDDLSQNERTMEDFIIDQDLVEHIWRALNTLNSNKKKKIFELKLKHYDSKEIMEKLNLSRSAYDTMVFRAIQDLKKILKKSRILSDEMY